MRFCQYIPVIIIVSMMMGCVVGRKMTYENTDIEPGYKLAKNTGITFYDRREEIVTGKSKPSYVGKLKASFQVAYNMQTESGKPLAEEFTNSLFNSLEKRGVHATKILLAHTDSLIKALDEFKQSTGELLFVFIIHKWKAESTPRLADIVDRVNGEIELQVYNKEGNLLTEKRESDLFEKKGQLAVSVRRLQEEAKNLFKTLLIKLYNNTAIRNLLQ